jgi:hypothetical protein
MVSGSCVAIETISLKTAYLPMEPRKEHSNTKRTERSGPYYLDSIGGLFGTITCVDFEVKLGWKAWVSSNPNGNSGPDFQEKLPCI